MNDTPLNERPLVTFALFAYNHEKYIREAVEGAFSQTYEPLEIILSDDFSTDRTFEIIREMAAMYDGPHRVIVRRNEANLGFTRHIDVVASMSQGAIVVMAAGDDVSLPERASVSVKGFQSSPGIFAVHTDFSGIKDKVHAPSNVMLKEDSILEILYRGGGIGKGATYAYRRECFFWPRPIPSDIFSEDRLLPFRAALMGRVIYMNVNTVAYREIAGSLGSQLLEKSLLPLQRQEHISALKEEILLAAAEGTVAKIWSQFLIRLISFRASVLNDCCLKRGDRTKNPAKLVKYLAHLLITKSIRSYPHRRKEIRVS